MDVIVSCCNINIMMSIKTLLLLETLGSFIFQGYERNCSKCNIIQNQLKNLL